MTAVHRWLAEPLPRDVGNALDRLANAPGVRHVAVMPDVHLAEHVCVGTDVGDGDGRDLRRGRRGVGVQRLLLAGGEHGLLC